MKTIEEAATHFSEGIRENSLSGNNAGKEQYKVGRKIGFKAGVDFAQRWIPVEEELPENSMTTSHLGHYKHTDKVIYKTSNGKYGITCRSKFLGSDWQWNGSGTLQGSITHWRPIKLK